MSRICRVAAIAFVIAGAARADPPTGGGAPAPLAGGWTREGWSDTAVSPRAVPEAVDPADVHLVPPPGAAAASGVAETRVRRRTWDGGRGRDYRYDRGGRLPAAFTGPAYVVSDWGGYGLAPPPAGASWVRYFDDAVLIDAEGRVIDAAPDIGWAQPPRPYREADTREIAADPAGPATYTYSVGPGTIVTHGPAGRITITTVTTPQVSTTTTVTGGAP